MSIREPDKAIGHDGAVEAPASGQLCAAISEQWVDLARFGLGLMLLCTVLVNMGVDWLDPGVFSGVSRLVVGGCVIALLVLPFMNLAGARTAVSPLQVALDLVLVALLVYFTGGVRSHFAHLYFLPILACAVLEAPRWALLCAGGASVLQVAIASVYGASLWSGGVPPLVRGAWGTDLTYAGLATLASHATAQVFGYFLVALLTSRLSQRLRTVRLMSSEVLDGIAEAVVAADTHGRLAYMNKEAVRLFNFGSQSDFMGQKVGHVFRRYSDEPVRRVLSGRARGVHTVWLEHRARQCRMEFEVTSAHIIDRQGATRGTVAVFSDLTLKRRAETAERRAERLDGIRQVAAAIAHEVRNPLACIKGGIQQLLPNPGLDEVEKELVTITLEECDRLNETISEFLNFARPRHPEPTPVNVADLLRETASLLARRSDLDPGRIRLDCPTTLPATVDPRLMKQVLLNLGLNAFDAMPDGGTLTLRAFECAGERHEIIIEFCDEGEGISEEACAQLFVRICLPQPVPAEPHALEALAAV